MNEYKGDIHIHTVLSPCGSLEMSPVNIVNKAEYEKLDIIGITDHNSTKHCEIVKKIAEKKDIFVLCGAEVNTSEEIHCLTFFESIDILKKFQLYLDQHINKTKNDPIKFGHQVVVDEKDNILEKVDYLLIASLGQTIDQVEEKVHELGGIFIPAHIDRPMYSLFSQLGFIPSGLKADALEISEYLNRNKIIKTMPELKNYNFIHNSDAHSIGRIGMKATSFILKERSFSEIHKALKNQDGRKVITKHFKK